MFAYVPIEETYIPRPVVMAFAGNPHSKSQYSDFPVIIAGEAMDVTPGEGISSRIIAYQGHVMRLEETDNPAWTRYPQVSEFESIMIEPLGSVYFPKSMNSLLRFPPAKLLSSAFHLGEEDFSQFSSYLKLEDRLRIHRPGFRTRLFDRFDLP